MLRYGSYSHSKLDVNNKCPRRFKYKYVLKLPEGETDKSALFKGIRVHNLFEKYPDFSTVKYDKESKDIFDRFLGSDLGKKYLSAQNPLKETQVKYALNGPSGTELVPFSGQRKDSLFNGNVDFVQFFDGVLNIIDWKTGKYKDLKYQDFDQLTFYQIEFFKKTDVQEIRVQYVYVEHLLENALVLKREYLPKYEELLLGYIDKQESSDFEPIRTRLCDWCPFQDVCSRDLS